jgi:hypothetical protein
MILAVTIAFFMGIIITVAVLTAFIVDVDVDVEKEQPDLTDEILNEIRQKITRYGQEIASETNEMARFVLIMKQDALADLYQDLELFVLTRQAKGSKGSQRARRLSLKEE